MEENRSVTKDETEEKRFRNIWKAVHCSVAMFICESAGNSVANIMSQTFSDNGFESLGFIVLGLFYGGLAVSAIFAPKIIHKFGVSKSMALGCTLESFWVFPLIFVTMKSQTAWYTSDSAIYLLNILCSLLSGIGASLIWIGQGKYISDCATPSSKGFYFGLFWAIYMASLIFGNAISAVILEYYTLKTFYLIMYGFFWAAIILFYNLRKPIKLSTNLVTKEITKQVSITEEVKELFKFMVGKKMLYLLPTVAWTGISIGVYSGLFTPIITESIEGDLEENEKLSKAFTAMIFLGIGEIVGGLVIGQVIDKIGNKLASLISFVSIIVQTVALMLYIETNNYGLLTFVMTFAWGFQDSVINTHLQETLGFEFEDNVKAYSAFNFIQCMTVFISLNTETLLTSKLTLQIFLIAVNIFGLLAIILNMRFPYSCHVNTPYLAQELRTLINN
ncbi:hypothetical protein FGO68_gene871 [Halteria grandinella]|uniref:UNC93-like protein MFSD11 n=1 Tax=Halteria grandinella TaxID=5974 RepID=A0A8J8NN84_HALGN|nr:hypothetical protein FGO68_gene871 [Halteria grandinella]